MYWLFVVAALEIVSKVADHANKTMKSSVSENTQLLTTSTFQ